MPHSATSFKALVFPLGAFLWVGVACGPRAIRIIPPPSLSAGRTNQIPGVRAQVVLLVESRVVAGRISFFGPLFAKTHCLLHLHLRSVAGLAAS